MLHVIFNVGCLYFTPFNQQFLHTSYKGLKFLTPRLHIKIAHLSRDPGSARVRT